MKLRRQGSEKDAQIDNSLKSDIQNDYLTCGIGTISAFQIITYYRRYDYYCHSQS